ncbi:hypothetical protein EIP91_001405 [Steccherinum ochraceum]|uniref:DUF6697 domain-containing protein n=1 Tax=Steccherinum ochraceum TaxID=92696 RepID=A0A4R0RUQ6_9APHY|nr:hypothetical protein EIP91_001405 [Steccherinum ochraceum]
MPDISGTRSPLMFIPPQLSAETTPHTTSFDYTTPATEHGTHSYQEYSPNLDIHLDKLRIVDALTARDVAVYRLQSACASIRAKEAALQKLERERDEMRMSLDMLDSGKRNKEGAEVFAEQRGQLLDKIAALEAANKALRAEVETLRAKQDSMSALNTPRFNEMAEQTLKGFPFIEEDSEVLSEPPKFLTSASSTSAVTGQDTSPLPDVRVVPVSSDSQLVDSEDSEVEVPEERMKARHAILAALPIPSNMPTDTLVPIVIPPPFSVHDFLGTIQGEMKTRLANYRVFQESTTSWCPEREEHGYFLTPAFKCVTNHRVSTAHRWIPVDLVEKCSKPIECFYNKENKWYYAGLYKPFHLKSLSATEYNALSQTTSQALIKETLSGRKNTSPQNLYETAQLYVCGALTVACVGLQCVGFSEGLYRALLDQAEVCGKVGRWRGVVTAAFASGGSGLGSVGAAWNVAANLVSSGQTTIPGIVKLPVTLGSENLKDGEKDDSGRR